MPLHLIKLCVGCASVAELGRHIERKRRGKVSGRPAPKHVHVTRMTPKRAPELLDGGSLYWVIRGQVACRQRLWGIEPFADRDGVRRCRLVLDPKLIPTQARAHRAFQGWRYLAPADAPKDLAGTGVSELPESLRRELHALGLL